MIATFQVESTTVEFLPRILENPREWVLMIESIKIRRDYHISCTSNNSQYVINYKGGKLSISLSGNSSHKVNTLTVNNIPITIYNMNTLEELRNLSQSMEENVKYIPVKNLQTLGEIRKFVQDIADRAIKYS